MRPVLATVVATLVLASSSSALAAPTELKISSDGILTAQNVVVMQRADTNLFCRAVWGNAFVRLTILTAPMGVPAKITKKNGGAATIADIKEGDVLNIKGTLTQSADYLLITASSIEDLSLVVEEKRVSGSLRSVDHGAQSFALTDKTLGAVTVFATSSTALTKGARTIAFGEMALGDRILAASGTYDYATHVLYASSVEVYQDPSVFMGKNFEGTLKSLSGSSLPATATVAIGDITYTVYLSANASVMSKNRTPVTLSRVVVGDTVRLWGSLRRTNLQEMDATVLRDLNF